LLGAASCTVWLTWEAGQAGIPALFPAAVAIAVLRVDKTACSRLIQSRPVRANGDLAKHVKNNKMAGHREPREIEVMVLFVRLQSTAQRGKKAAEDCHAKEDRYSNDKKFTHSVHTVQARSSSLFPKLGRARPIVTNMHLHAELADCLASQTETPIMSQASEIKEEGSSVKKIVTKTEKKIYMCISGIS
jgi:hypothetical protein